MMEYRDLWVVMPLLLLGTISLMINIIGFCKILGGKNFATMGYFIWNLARRELAHALSPNLYLNEKNQQNSLK